MRIHAAFEKFWSPQAKPATSSLNGRAERQLLPRRQSLACAQIIYLHEN
jgi:hypothetical protein